MFERYSYREAEKDTEGARALGWTSLGIGLAELAAPRQVEKLLGLEDRPAHRGVLQILGVRELVHGWSLLTEDRPNARMACGVWSRVAGDVLDTAMLGVAAMKTKKPASFAMVAASVLVIGALDLYFAQRMARHRGRYD